MEENTEDDGNTRARLEELGLTQDQIDDLTPLLAKQVSTEQEVPVSIQDLRTKLAIEADYTKRAVLAARIISLSLDGEY